MNSGSQLAAEFVGGEEDDGLVDTFVPMNTQQLRRESPGAR
ncbi:MAG: hypothetical protein ACFCUP_14260 [Actinomycetales bacterium]